MDQVIFSKHGSGRKDRHIQDIKEDLKKKFQTGKEWVVRNKEAIMIFTPIVVGGITAIAKIAVRQSHLKQEKDLKELYCYDRSLGHYWRLKRDLSNKEWVEMDQRKRNGERLADILDELRVLK